ncbi:SpoIID/LytB domain-containing protein [Claveliimonas bilis]|uniref:Stage II sporulation protein D n=1 Tax=Claveliimonas bilis TaxID=3028070 RepID=A0ABN6YTQ6_9FIRM|nr:SpoIID/LytB domain-containing protein [Claveliimonas bilis]BDZ75963.1 stage II sporulation protein D [Claveliimonas bilis]
MRQKLKKMGCYIIIIVLLPYVVTVFLNGPSIETAAPADEMEVMVKQGEKEIQLPLDEYGIGRMAKEIPASYEEEAIKVQAILVRTAVYKQLKEEGSEAVLADDFWTEKEMKEEWGSRKFSEYYRKMENAWQETEGQVVMYGEELANTPFTRLTNGSTRDGKEVLGSEDYPYLKIKECPLDIESKDQIRTVTTEDMDAEIKETDTAGYVTSVRVGEETMSGEEFREKYKLDSSCFILQKYDGKMRITTRGIGHGLGLSQYTANEMAKEEKTTEEILQYFFEGTEIREVAEIIRNSGNTE